MLLIFSNIYHRIFNLFLSKCKLVTPPLKGAEEVCFEEAKLSFLRSGSTRRESLPLLCKQALSPSTSSCPRLWTAQRENHLEEQNKRWPSRHFPGLPPRSYFLNGYDHLVFMAIVGQGSQASVSVPWECFPHKAPVVCKYLTTMCNYSQSKNFHTSQL